MSPKPEGSFETAQPEHRWVTRSLARAGVHLGQAVTVALSERLGALEERLNSTAIPKSGGAAHGRMRDLLHQDRALLAVRDSAARKERVAPHDQHDEQDGREPSVVVPKRADSRGAAQGRMRELLQRDRAMLAGNDDWDDDVIAPVPVPVPVPIIEEPAKPVEVEAAAPQPTAAVLASPVICVASRAAEPQPTAAPIEAKPAMPSLSLSSLSTLSVPPKPATQAAQAADDNAPIRTRTMARLLALQGHKEQALSIYDELIKRDSWDNGLIEEAERLRR